MALKPSLGPGPRPGFQGLGTASRHYTPCLRCGHPAPSAEIVAFGVCRRCLEAGKEEK